MALMALMALLQVVLVTRSNLQKSCFVTIQHRVRPLPEATILTAPFVKLR